MHRRKVVTATTLGDLIVAVTDEVDRYLQDPSVKYQMVAMVVADLLERDHPVLHRLAEELQQEETEYRSAS